MPGVPPEDRDRTGAAGVLACDCGAAYPVERADGVRLRCSACGAALAGGDLPPDAEERTLYPPRLPAAGPRALGPGPPVRRLGRYVLLDEIGRGGMGVVYRAYDPERSRLVALKVLLAGDHSSPEHVERFLREAAVAARLDHDNVIPVLDTGWDDRRAYFTMPLVEGPALDEVVADARAAGRPIRPAEAVRIARAIAAALDAAHHAGLVHRDVKPSNVLLTCDGVPKLGDFGLAAEMEGTSRLTRSGQILGTPAYMAPEQLVSNAPPTPATDQYALGAVLYELLAGVPPYEGADPVSVIRRVMDGPPRPILALRPDLPGGLAVVVAKAMSRDPEDRYPSLRAFADDLRRAVRGEPTVARAPRVPDRIVGFLRRNQRALSVIAVLAIAAVVAIQGTSVIRSVVVKRAWAERERAAAMQATAVHQRAAALREAGDPEAAAEVLRRFADAPRFRGTRAAANALIRRADLLADHPDATEAWAAAYAGAAGAADQDLALRGMASHFGRSWRWRALGAVVDSLVARSPGAAVDPVVARWRVQALLATDHLDEAIRTATEAALPDAPLVAALARRQRVPGFDGGVIAGPDGTLWGWAPGSDRVRSLRPDGAVAWEAALPEPVTELLPVDAGGPMLVVRDRSGRAALVRAEGRLDPLVAWDADAPLLAATATDLDRDDRPEIWVGIGPYERALVRLALDGGRWTVDRPMSAVDATRSDIGGVVAADLDADGRSELVVAAGAWRAYDVRVVDLDGRRARIKLGQVHGLAVDRADPRAVWVAKENRFPSRLMFPPEAPYGALPGVRRLRLGDRGALIVDRFLPSPLADPRIASSVGPPFQADLDGDGADEVLFRVADAHRAGVVVVPAGQPDRSPWILPGLDVRAVLSGDDGGGDRVVVRSTADGTGWILGTGHDAPPPPAWTTERAPVPDDVGPPAVSRLWGRAEELVGMGMFAAAVDELVMLAETAPAPVARRARQRAASLADTLGDDRRAAALYEQIGDPDALRLAAAAHLRGHRPDDALRTLLAARDGGVEDPRLAALASVVERTRTRRWAFPGTAWDGAADPLAVRPSAEGLRVATFADHAEPALGIPFRWAGERLSLEVELEVLRLEWAGGIGFALVGPDGERFGLQISGWGGGERLEEEVGCEAPGGGRWSQRTGRESPSAPRKLRLALDLSALTGDVRCRLGPGRDDERNLALGRMPAPGRWTLEVAATRHGGVEAPAVAEVRLHALTLSADDLRIEPDAAPPGPDPVAEAVTLADAGHPEAAEAVLRGLPSDDAVERRLATALRVHPATFGPTVRAAVGIERYYALFERAFGVPIGAHPDDPVLGVALTTGTPDLEALADRPGKAARQRAIRLLAARGRAWAALGQASAARRDLRLVTRLDAPGSASPDDDVPDRLAAVWLELAALEAAEGDPVEALAAVTEAIRVSSSPELTADRVRAMPALAAHADAPAWAAVLPE